MLIIKPITLDGLEYRVRGTVIGDPSNQIAEIAVIDNNANEISISDQEYVQASQLIAAEMQTYCDQRTTSYSTPFQLQAF